MSVLILFLAVMLSQASRGEPQPTRGATIEDAIYMTRIQANVAPDGSVAAISPNGRFAAVVTWKGNLIRDVNEYSLLLLDLQTLAPPKTLVSWAFEGDPEDQSASPFSQVSFLPDNRTLAFIGRCDNARPQVFTIDTQTRRVAKLTESATAVRSYVVRSDGRLAAYSAAVNIDDGTQREQRLRDGSFLWDDSLFPVRSRLFRALPILDHRARLARQYFLVTSQGPLLLYDSRQARSPSQPDLDDPRVAASVTFGLDEEISFRSWGVFIADPTGQFALLHPYAPRNLQLKPEQWAYYADKNAYAQRTATPYAVVDLRTGSIRPLIDAPHPQFDPGSGRPVWASDGRSVLIFSLLPPSGTNENTRRDLPQWLEVNIATGKTIPVPVPTGWIPLRLNDTEASIILTNGIRIGRLKRAAGLWGSFEDIGQAAGMSPRFRVATDGRSVIGVVESSGRAPEIAVTNLLTGNRRPLTDLNPQLKEVSLGSVERMEWRHRYAEVATGFLTKPLSFVDGKRYPAVILLDDGTTGQDGDPFIFDGVDQLSAYAIQVLAAHGFLVLYLREPESLRKVIGSPLEPEYMREHVDSAAKALVQRGLADSHRIGLSGWSRAAYYVDHVLMNSTSGIAAAAQIDGGSVDYIDRMRPFSDAELLCIRAPLLIEAHRPYSLVMATSMADRLEANGAPTEILYFPEASHSTTRPRQRRQSLAVNLEWWRFWLQDDEDAAPESVERLRQWRRLRDMRDALNARTSIQARQRPTCDRERGEEGQAPTPH